MDRRENPRWIKGQLATMQVARSARLMVDCLVKEAYDTMAGSEESCPACHGRGDMGGKNAKLCGTCKGSGRVTVNRRSTAKNQKPEKKKGWW